MEELLVVQNHREVFFRSQKRASVYDKLGQIWFGLRNLNDWGSDLQITALEKTKGTCIAVVDPCL
jgi:hypothetical protein